MGDNETLFGKYRYHNPFFRARGQMDQRRKELFTLQRNKIPGAFSKASFAAIWFSMLYGCYCFKRFRREKERYETVAYEYRRKVTPFIQAIEDRQFLVTQ